MDTIKDYFIEKINQKYSVTENLARLLFDRWNVGVKYSSKSDVDDFLNSQKVFKVFFIVPDINISKKYTVDELSKLGVNLSIVIDADKKIYKDDKHGFTWQEQYHGFSEAYIGLYQVIDPKPDDKELCDS